MAESDGEQSIEEGEASSSSSGESAPSVAGAERCPICLNRFRDEVVGTPETCSHTFCVECLYEWAQQTATCPVDRSSFENVLVRSLESGRLIRKMVVEKVSKPEEDSPEDLTYCEVCNRCDREDQLLLCDGCDAGYHLDCLSPPLATVPIEEWFCPVCQPSFIPDTSITSERRRTSRGIPRTRAAERLRSRIARRQERIVTASSENLSLTEGDEEPATRYLLADKCNDKDKKTYRRHGSSRKRHSHRRKRRKHRKTSTSHSSHTRKRRRHNARRSIEDSSKPRSVQSRLASTLGLRPSRDYIFPEYHAKPSLHKSSSSGGSGSRTARASLRISFDPRKEFLPFEENDEPECSRSPVRSEPKISNKAEAFNKPIRKTQSSSNSYRDNDVLGHIMEKQATLGMSSKNLTIGKDGSITVKEDDGVSSHKTSSRHQDHHYSRDHERDRERDKERDRDRAAVRSSSSSRDHGDKRRKEKGTSSHVNSGSNSRSHRSRSRHGKEPNKTRRSSPAERRCSAEASCSKSASKTATMVVPSPVLPFSQSKCQPLDSVECKSMDFSDDDLHDRELPSQGSPQRTTDKKPPPAPVPLPNPAGSMAARFFTDLSREKTTKLADSQLPTLLDLPFTVAGRLCDTNSASAASNEGSDGGGSKPVLSKLFSTSIPSFSSALDDQLKEAFSTLMRRGDASEKTPTSFLSSNQNQNHIFPPPLADALSNLSVAAPSEDHVETGLSKLSKSAPDAIDPAAEAFRLAVERKVKNVLAPFYKRQKINKDEYKYVMRRTVPQIWKKGGRLNSVKIQAFVEAYVKKVMTAKRRHRHDRKSSPLQSNSQSQGS